MGAERSVVGPGSVRVGRFIGRVGVVAMQSLVVGLDLDERVVRRHVAKLQAVGWLERASLYWGEGSIVWLTPAGVDGVGLHGVAAVSSPPKTIAILNSVLVGWSAARVEHRGLVWKSHRELDRKQFGVLIPRGGGFSRMLPDLAVWTTLSGPPAAVVIHTGGRRPEREKVVLEGWQAAIVARQYRAVQFDCTSQSLAKPITRLASTLCFTHPAVHACVQLGAEQIAALPRACAVEDGAGPTAVGYTLPAPDEYRAPAADEPPAPGPDELPGPLETEREPTRAREPVVHCEPQQESPEKAAERERLYRELFGIEDP